MHDCGYLCIKQSLEMSGAYHQRVMSFPVTTDPFRIIFIAKRGAVIGIKNTSNCL